MWVRWARNAVGVRFRESIGRVGNLQEALSSLARSKYAVFVTATYPNFTRLTLRSSGQRQHVTSVVVGDNATLETLVF